MDRRRFLQTVSVGLLAVPVVATAQQAGKVHRVGLLSPAPAAAASGSPYNVFREGLRELGYVEGKNLVLEFRFAGGYARMAEFAADLVRLQVDVILTDGGNATASAALNATRTIPIVMGTTSDPVASGLVTSLTRPGGNITGFTFPSVELTGKRLQLLKEMVPAVTRVAVLWEQPNGVQQFRAAEAAAPGLGLQLESLPVRGPADFDAAFETASRNRAGALLQASSRMLSDHRKAIVERALTHRLPGMFELGFPEVGGLASYGPNVRDNFRRAAVYVDKILQGTRAGDLPISQPSTFELVINMKAAKALRLPIPPSLLVQATTTIE